MKLIQNFSEVNIGDLILYKIEDINRVYSVLGIDFDGIHDRKLIYSSDGAHSNAFISRTVIKNTCWYLLNEKEVNYYLKLMIFSS